MRLRPAALAIGCAMLAVAACSSGGAPSGAGSAPPGEPIVFGVQQDANGPSSSYSVITTQAIKDAATRINSQGGILGRPVEVKVASDDSDPTRAPAVTRQLLEGGADVMFFTTSAGAAIQSKPLVYEAHVPSFAPTTFSTNLIAAPQGDYSFLIANGTPDVAKLYADAFKAAGITRIAVFSDASPTIAAINKVLIPGITGAGIEVVSTEQAPADAGDVSAQVQRIASARPQAILLSTLGGPIEALFHNTAYLQTPEIPRFSLASIGNQPDVWDQVQPDALNGVVFIASLTDKNPRTADLGEYLKGERSDFTRLTAYDAQGYDAAYLAKTAIEKAGSPDDGTAVAKAIEGITDYQPHFGQAGYTLRFGADDHDGSNGPCGMILTEFTGNEPGEPWSRYQPSC
ncbi:branched-chain amino acid ABC transporter substrate-binding protein [Pseudonocardia sulfidoxydans NBRC 16205]|uniref:Branched-chain amino acid ABC transporter substrate-binding protein n=2 Tax=Pseudonocardia sulfidoxydans TaxID=54011 RepID=A0A511D8V0_9PSEU|nr:branched-chain amino acid ABC transporter substrate-binding protein [Pseudonocardia sulfidoxydans NBRC 16205]